MLKGMQQCDGQITGFVKSEAGRALPGASVKILSIDKTVVTDERGSFSFTGLCHGIFEIEISYVGYSNQNLVVEDFAQELIVTLQLEQTVLQDVTIEGEQSQKSLSQTSSVLLKEDLGALHGKALGESLKEIPGVNALQTGPAIFKPVIHGLHSQRILILMNGIRLEGQQWGVEHAPEVDPYIASQIEVVKGSETVRYGADAIGGVIIINPPPLHQTQKLGGEFNLGFISNNRMGVFSAMLEGTLKPWKHWSWRLQSSAKKGGDFHTPDYNLSNTGLEEINFSGALGFQHDHHGIELYVSSFNTSIGILRAAHTGNLNDLQQSIESEKPWYIRDFTYDINNPRQKINHHLIKIKAYEQVKSFGRINILYGGQYNQRKEFDIRRGDRSSKPALSLGLISNVLDVSLDHEKGNHSGSFGVNGTLKYNKNDTDETGIAPLIPDYNQMSMGVFLSEKWNLNKWTWEAGGRYDHQYLLVKTFQQNVLLKPDFKFHYISGTIGTTYRWNANWRVIANAGFSSRPPHVSELYSEGLHHGSASIEEGLMRPNGEVLTEQDEIIKEMSKKIIATLQHNSERASLDFSVYYNDIDNYIYLRPYETRLTIRGYFPVFRYNQNNAILTGSDLSLKYELSKRFNYNLKASYIYAKDKDNEEVLPFIPPAQIENGLTIKFGSKKVENLFLTINLPYTFQQTRAPRVVFPQDVPNDLGSEIFDFAPAPNGYLLLNASVGFKIPVHKHLLSLNFAVENLLNETYRNYMNRLRYYSDEVGRNFTVRLSYDFLQH
jgi:iron complex outermembrane receptor protein